MKSLRARIVLYVVALHLLLGGMAFYSLLDRPMLLLAAEVVFGISAITGYWLLRSFFVPLELIRTGSELMRERDFSAHFTEVGQREMDDLIRIYNTMIDQLREERRTVEERNLFLDRLLDASPSGVVTLDHDGRISQINPAAARLAERGGGATDAGGGKSSQAGLVGASADVFPPAVARALRELRDGGSAVVSWRGSHRLKIRRGSFYDRGAMRDFFLFEELTEELRASERAAYGKLIRMMSHEVNNSVGAVRSLLESCQSYEGQLRPEDRGDYGQAIDVAVRRLLNLNAFMNDLARVVRIPPPDLRPCDLPALMDDIATLMHPDLGRRRIRLVWERPQAFPTLSLDKNQMEQALVNILRNAAEAVGSDGTVTVTLAADGGGPPYLAVRDTGPGIPPESEAHLFTPFFSTKREGQGIGLTLVREILARHALEFDLRNVEGGAEFRIFF